MQVFFRNRIFSSNSQSGQVGVVILLIMVVLMTIGLSLASRTSRELLLSRQQEDTTRVFNAAEAGLEEALASDLSAITSSVSQSIDGFAGTNVNVDYTINPVNQLQTRLFEMMSVTIDVEGSDDGDVLLVDWSYYDDCDANSIASMVVTTFYDDAGTIRALHQPFSACDRSDGFTSADDLSDDSDFNFRAEVTLPADAVLVRVKPVYTDTNVRISSTGWTLPTQAYNIRSQADNTDGGETRIVQVEQTLPSAPSIMDYALVSGTTILK